MKVNCVVEKKFFIDEKTEEQKRYYAFSAVLDGRKIQLKPVEKDKGLVNYILDNKYEEEK